MGFEYEVRLAGRGRDGLLDGLVDLLGDGLGLVVVGRGVDGLELARAADASARSARWHCDLEISLTETGLFVVFHEGTGRRAVLDALEAGLRRSGFAVEVEDV